MEGWGKEEKVQAPEIINMAFFSPKYVAVTYGDGVYTPPPPGDGASPRFPGIVKRAGVYNIPVNSRVPPFTTPPSRRRCGGVYGGIREFTGQMYTSAR
jgi:hypothetical protein